MPDHSSPAKILLTSNRRSNLTLDLHCPSLQVVSSQGLKNFSRVRTALEEHYFTHSSKTFQFLAICLLLLVGELRREITQLMKSIPWPVFRDIASASIGPRSSLATGPEELEASKWELEEDTERFIQAAEVGIALVWWRVEDLILCPRKSSNRTRGPPIMFSYSPQAFRMEEWKTQIPRLLLQPLYRA
jgi:hypothetical protein